MANPEIPDRGRVQRRLDRLVVEHRFTIAVVFPAVGALALLASAEGLLPDPVSFNPYLLLFGVAVMRLPLIAGVAPLATRRLAVGVGVLCLYAWTVETIGVRTGYPYGSFEYGVDLGPMLAGEVPVALPLLFLPLVANAYLLSLLLLGGAAGRTALRVPLAVALAVATDLVLDPAAVAVGFWTYEAGGSYYGVPWTNFAGWVLSTTVAVVVTDVSFERDALIARLDDCRFALDDLVSFVVLWGGVNAFYRNWIPAALAAAFGYALWRTGRFDFPAR